MPALIGNPRSTVVFGRDSAADIYLEAYGLNGARDARVALQISDENGARIWRDTVPLAGSGAVHNADVHSAIVTVPLMKIGVGRESLSASLVGVPNVGATMTSPVFVSLGEEWALVSFDEMLHYLRWFTTSARLDSLRAAPPERRAAAWSAFLKATDPVPATPEHEGLRTYFARLQTANERFREESPQGWATDRGRVYITLGEPEQMVVQAENTVTRRGRVQVWSYPQYNLRIVFLDQTGFGHWQLSPESEAELESVAQRERERE
jgi:GWxTD domain-containing protein